MARFRSTAAAESSLVCPRFSDLPPYARENPPGRVEKPWTSHGNLLRYGTRRMFILLCSEIRFGTELCYLKQSLTFPAGPLLPYGPQKFLFVFFHLPD